MSILGMRPIVQFFQKIPEVFRKGTASGDTEQMFEQLMDEVRGDSLLTASPSTRAVQLTRCILSPIHETAMVDMKLVRSATAVGVPGEDHAVRMNAWLLLLEVLPTDRKSWRFVSEQRSIQYHKLINKMLDETVKRIPEKNQEQTVCQCCSARLMDADFETLDWDWNMSSHNPGVTDTKSRKRKVACTTRTCDYFVDHELLDDQQNLELINADVQRTLNELQFFNGEVLHRQHNNVHFTETADHPSISQHKGADMDPIQAALAAPVYKRTPRSSLEVPSTSGSGEEDATGRAAGAQIAMRRILLTYSKLHHGVYTQGMNEVLAPLYYIIVKGFSKMTSGPLADAIVDPEALAFWAFSGLMAQFHVNFIVDKDATELGIQAQMARMMAVLREEDPALHDHLTEELGIEPCLFAFKWFGTLFTQTFLLPDLMRLWDSLVSVTDSHRVEFFVCLAVAFILLANAQDRLLHSDQLQALQILQATVGELPEADSLARLAYLIFVKHNSEYMDWHVA